MINTKDEEQVISTDKENLIKKYKCPGDLHGHNRNGNTIGASCTAENSTTFKEQLPINTNYGGGLSTIPAIGNRTNDLSEVLNSIKTRHNTKRLPKRLPAIGPNTNQ